MTNPFTHERRRPLTTIQRTKLFLEHRGRCVLCKEPINGVKERWIDEHIIPLARGGTNAWENRGPAHVGCAREKTRADLAGAAKDKRIYAKHIGAKQATMPGSRNSQWKKKMDGSVVRRGS